MASFESAVFGGGGSKSKESEKYPLRRVEPALRRFVKVADIDLNRLRQHRGNIEKVGQRISHCAALCWGLL